jgi:hypothetical protein
VTDRSNRSLVNLQKNASTARTLNLLDVWRRHHETDEYLRQPFFRSPVLNKAIIVKHRLRTNEIDLFPDWQASATKVILPIDSTDLRLGAHSFFVNQRGYQEFMREVSSIGPEIDPQDDAMLQLLDSLPSLDPFLMRERLRKVGMQPAALYFDLTEADNKRIFQFVRQELTPLIGLSFQDVDASFNDRTSKLASKILSNGGDEELEPLRLGMGMQRGEFQEGVFCWKGFIYYKWTLSDLLPRVRPVMQEIAAIAPFGPASYDEKSYILNTRESLAVSIGRACETVRTTLKVYDDAYADLTRNGQPLAFRSFLMKAPSLFHELGERLGAIHHIVSFWRYRFQPGVKQKIAAEELVDLLSDFESSLSFGPLVDQTA